MERKEEYEKMAVDFEHDRQVNGYHHFRRLEIILSFLKKLGEKLLSNWELLTVLSMAGIQDATKMIQNTGIPIIQSIGTGELGVLHSWQQNVSIILIHKYILSIQAPQQYDAVLL